MPRPYHKNPLKDYVDPISSPEMTVDGITINKSYPYTGAVDSLNVQSQTFPSPQSTQVSTPGPTKLNNKKVKKNQQNYWVSPSDTLGSKDITAVQLQLKIPTSSNLTFFNYLSFDFSDVPANWSVYYKNPISGIMNQLTDINGNYVGGTTLGLGGYNNGNFQWVHIEIQTQVIGTTLLELRFDRNVKLNFRPQEINPFNINNGYPFWLRNVDLKLNATSWDQVPNTAVITSRNALGLTENYVITQKDSSQIQHPIDRTAVLANTSSYWKSSPQPVGDAVVNLYVDLGSQQTIDSMYMDPLYSGVQCNLYYSNDPTVNDIFYCSRSQTNLTQKSSSYLVTFNNVGQQTYGILPPTSSGAVFGNANNYGLLTPSTIGFNSSSSWSIGLKYSPNTSMPTGSTQYTLLNQQVGGNDSIAIYFKNTNTNVTFTAVINGKTVSVNTVGKISQDSTGWPWYGIVINYDASNTSSPIYSITVDNHSSLTSSNTATGSSNFATDTPFTLGNSVSGSSPSYGTIKDFWIRQDVASSQVMQSYFSNPRLFINSNGPATSLRGDYRALLLAPLYSSTIRSNPGSGYYETKEWIPLQSDISVRKATYSLPTISARYIKLEFTNLSPEVYPLTSGSIERTVKLFPSWVVNYFNQIEQQLLDTNSQQYFGIQTNSAAGTLPPNNFQSPTTVTGAAQEQFVSPVTLTELNATQLGTSAEPSQNTITSIVDPTSSSSLLSSLIGSESPSSDTELPSYLPLRFPQTCIHNYNIIQINQTWNKSYFAGLAALNFYKVNQIIIDDTEYYFDNCSITPSTSGTSGSIFTSTNMTFSFNSSNASQPLGYNATATGNVLYTNAFQSYDQVTGLQIASITSDWVSPMPIDQVMMTNNNLGYLNTGTSLANSTSYNVITPLPQISTFNLATGVWQFSPNSSNATYGVATIPISLSPSGLDTTNMRCSAIARIFLPNTNNGTYQLNLYGILDSNSSPTLLNSITTKVPLNNWIDIQIPYSSIQNNIKKLYVELLQIDTTVNEVFYLTMFAPFYHPISWSYALSSGGPWLPITTAINNPYAFASFSTSSTSFTLKAQSYTTNANIKSLLIRPIYQQNPYTPQTSIDYFPDPRTNEVISKVAPCDHPMFHLNNNYYPANLTLSNTIISS